MLNADRRQQDEEEVQPVDAELVVDAERLDPRLVGDVLQAAAGVEVDDERDGVAQRAERARERDPARGAAAQREGDEAGDRREPEQEGQVQGHEASRRNQRSAPAMPSEHERGVGAQEAGLARADGRAAGADEAGRCRRRTAPLTTTPLERRLREAPEPQRGPDDRRVERLVAVPAVREQRVERARSASRMRAGGARPLDPHEPRDRDAGDAEQRAEGEAAEGERVGRVQLLEQARLGERRLEEVVDDLGDVRDLQDAADDRADREHAHGELHRRASSRRCGAPRRGSRRRCPPPRR